MQGVQCLRRGVWRAALGSTCCLRRWHAGEWRMRACGAGTWQAVAARPESVCSGSAVHVSAGAAGAAAGPPVCLSFLLVGWLSCSRGWPSQLRLALFDFSSGVAAVWSLSLYFVVTDCQVQHSCARGGGGVGARLLLLSSAAGSRYTHWCGGEGGQAPVQLACGAAGPAFPFCTPLLLST
jgi:hypothetical protein